jgi:hypothetical protein
MVVIITIIIPFAKHLLSAHCLLFQSCQYSVIVNMSVLKFCCPVRWGRVPCHHVMVHPQVADGGDSLQIWRVAANIWNKQSWRADKGWSSSLGLGVGLTTPHRKK